MEMDTRLTKFALNWWLCCLSILFDLYPLSYISVNAVPLLLSHCNWVGFVETCPPATLPCFWCRKTIKIGYVIEVLFFDKCHLLVGLFALFIGVSMQLFSVNVSLKGIDHTFIIN